VSPDPTFRTRNLAGDVTAPEAGKLEEWA